MIFISMKMITKAVGTVNSSTAVAARMKRTRSMLSLTTSTTISSSHGISPICHSDEQQDRQQHAKEQQRQEDLAAERQPMPRPRDY